MSHSPEDASLIGGFLLFLMPLLTFLAIRRCKRNL